MPFTEDTFERAVLEIFENLGYTHFYGPDLARDYGSPLLESVLRETLVRLNRGLPTEAISEAIAKLRDFGGGSLLQKNMVFMEYLQNGVPVRYFVNGEERNVIVYLIDYQNVDRNCFYAVNQFTYIENGNNRRPDIILFINGLPLVLCELKSPSKDEVNAENAYNQIRNYMQDIPGMFIYNAICVISDLTTNKAGTITSGLDRFMEWKTKDGSYENTALAQFDTFYEGMFDQARLLDIIKNFICFSVEQSTSSKILAGYHQYFAVRKAVEKARIATKTDGKGGVFWHTQGSGKSLSMVFYAHLLQEALDSPTIVVMTDRIDLDDQLYSQFSKCAAFLRQTPVQAESKVHLKKLLEGRSANGIIFTTMFKFEEREKPLSDRRNIVVMADEAHRGQYGMDERIVMSQNEDGETEARIAVGNARIIRDALPNATFIGFTGTPVSSKDRNTREVFGDYIDIYDMTQAVEDGATRPVYYESRVIHLKLDENTLALIDSTYDILAQQADAETIAKSKRMMGQLESVLGADSTVTSLVDDIVHHYETNRANLLTGKAMIVAYSRPIAMKIYRRLMEVRPDWKEKVGVVMTSGNNDPEDWKEIIGTKGHKEELARKFKDNNDPMKIAIVVDMWLTGFDVPSLATMYVYKPMHGYNLMQAIARVNRVFKDKEGGLIVDYVGIAGALKAAMNEYTARDRSKYGDMDIAKTAYPKFQEKLQVCRDLFHGFDYSGFIGGSPLTMAKLIADGSNFVLDPKAQNRKELFLKEALLTKQALSLCSSMTSETERHEQAYFEAVRSTVIKLTYDGNGGKPMSLKEINAQINELLKASVQSEGVISLFDSRKVGENFSLFDPAVLEEITRMKQKNIAIEILKKLLAEQVSIYKRTNVVQSTKFSEMITRIMNAYYNGHISNDEVIKELMEAAEMIAKAHQAGDALGLTQEELAFYDALTRPQAIKDFYENETLVEMTRELTEMLRRNRTIDWQKKETARATMRKMVKRLLKKYKYPPEEYEDAIDTVISQCEMWVDN
ncbi:MAG TPA: type I restriction endonuclease subunit R [Candidatus Pullichristensenella excrementipullorum]|nr:type I restriction endonuclease subunit R [Candidatus Pullichristensenella excrementipullorum]